MKEENNEIVSAAEIISVDYEEILQRAVAVIENARTSVARHLATTASNTYWEIGKLLHEKKLEKTISAEIHSFELEQAVKTQQKKKEDVK